MDAKSPRVQPARHRRVFTPARVQTDLDPQNCDESIEGDGVVPSFLLHEDFGAPSSLLHGDFGALWLHVDRSGKAAAGALLIKEPRRTRPARSRRGEDLTMKSCMIDSKSRVDEAESGGLRDTEIENYERPC